MEETQREKEADVPHRDGGQDAVAREGQAEHEVLALARRLVHGPQREVVHVVASAHEGVRDPARVQVALDGSLVVHVAHAAGSGGRREHDVCDARPYRCLDQRPRQAQLSLEVGLQRAGVEERSVEEQAVHALQSQRCEGGLAEVSHEYARAALAEGRRCLRKRVTVAMSTGTPLAASASSVAPP
jgi:hypothetical protein